MREYKRSLTPEARAQDAREKRLRKYGISGAIFDQMVAAQDGRCGICFERPPDDEILNVDHCHASGEVRGLLCRSCNTALGLLGDDASRLRSALAYLTRGARAYHDCSLLSANERPLP